MNVSSANRNNPNCIKSLKLNLFFISTTPILYRMKVSHPVTRLFLDVILAYYIFDYNNLKRIERIVYVPCMYIRQRTSETSFLAVFENIRYSSIPVCGIRIKCYYLYL